MPALPDSPPPLEFNPATSGHLAKVSHAGSLVSCQRAFTIETATDDATLTTLEGILDTELELSGNCGGFHIQIHLEQLGHHSRVTVDGIQATEIGRLSLHQSYDSSLRLDFALTFPGGRALEFGGLFILDADAPEAP
jgi:hypothetical protein